MEPIKKTISIGDKSVAIMAEKIIRKDHSVVIKTDPQHHDDNVR